jgi:hypothetical protein
MAEQPRQVLQFVARGQIHQLAGENVQPLTGDHMTDQTREEVDAKIAAAEARTDTKITRLEGKIDLVISKLDTVLEDGRSARSNMWLIGFGLAALVVAIWVAVPSIFISGAQLRDLIESTIKSTH